MNVKYVRISTVHQNSDRQKVDQEKYDLIIEDKCSGSIPYFERPNGCRIKEMVKKRDLTHLFVHSIDRLGRNQMDILQTVEYFNQHKIPITIMDLGLRTLDTEGKVNAVAQLIFSVMSSVAEMERNHILERQKEGIAIAKMRGQYLGRQPGTVETVEQFLEKPKNKKILAYLDKGTYSITEISRIVGCSINLVKKVRDTYNSLAA